MLAVYRISLARRLEGVLIPAVADVYDALTIAKYWTIRYVEHAGTQIEIEPSRTQNSEQPRHVTKSVAFSKP